MKNIHCRIDIPICLITAILTPIVPDGQCQLLFRFQVEARTQLRRVFRVYFHHFPTVALSLAGQHLYESSPVRFRNRTCKFVIFHHVQHIQILDIKGIRLFNQFCSQLMQTAARMGLEPGKPATGEKNIDRLFPSVSEDSAGSHIGNRHNPDRCV